ncbi:MAG: hypothetical protein RBR71_09135 [Gudongella sp.]|nr:hypothetical protein [Gudongella sp.]
MKNKNLIVLFLSLIMVFGITACKKEEPAVEEPTTPVIEEPVEEAEEDEKKAILDEYQKLVDEQKPVEELSEFIKENLSKMGQLEGNSMFNSLELAMERELEDLRIEIEELDEDFELVNIIGSNGYLKEDKIEDIKNEDLKEVIQEAYNNYYRVLSGEGTAFPTIDYTKLMDFEDKLTSEWQEYLELKSEELEKPAFGDGSLLLTFDELAERILKIENYLNRYINGPRQEALLESYEMYLTNYYKGLPNTPIAEYDTNMIFENVFKSYQSTAANQGYVTSSMIQEYLTAIRDNGMVVDDSIMKLADQYIEESARVLREFK